MIARSPRTRRCLTLLHGAHPSPTPTPTPGIVIRDAHGEAVLIELGEVFYRREQDQERVRRHREADRIRKQLAGDRRAAALANRLVDLTWQEAIDDQDEVLRRIGWVLVTNGRQDLWQLVYLEANRGNAYVLGDEVRFLLEQPLGVPKPLREMKGDVS